jgi:hypothetical protein
VSVLVVVVMSSSRSAAFLEGEEDVEGLLEGSSGKIWSLFGGIRRSQTGHQASSIRWGGKFVTGSKGC